MYHINFFIYRDDDSETATAGILAIILYLMCHQDYIRNGYLEDAFNFLHDDPFVQPLFEKLECREYCDRLAADELAIESAVNLYDEVEMVYGLARVGDLYAEEMGYHSLRDELNSEQDQNIIWKRAMRIYLIRKSEYDPPLVNHYRKLAVQELQDTNQAFDDTLSRMRADEEENEYPIRNAMALYRQYHIPMQKLLDDYAVILQRRDKLNAVWDGKKAKRLNPWKHIHEDDFSEIESGLSYMETAFNKGAWEMRDCKPTDVIRLLFYGQKEEGCLFTEERLMMPEMSGVGLNFLKQPEMIVNPNPIFLTDYIRWLDREIEAFKCQKPHGWESMDYTNRLRYEGDVYVGTIFVVKSDLSCQLYAYQYPTYRFITLEQAYEKRFCNWILIFAKEQQLEPFYKLFDGLAEGAEIRLLTSELYLKDIEFQRLLHEKNISVDVIGKVPANYVNSRISRKMVLIGHRRRRDELMDVDHQVTLVSDDEIEEAVYWEQRWYMSSHYHVPITSLWTCTSLRQLLQSLKRLENGLAAEPVERTCKTFEFSKEIKISYTLMQNRKNRFSAKAHYCEIQGKDSSRKKGKTLVQPTERGLRAETREAVLERLAEVPFRPEFYDVIRMDIERVYDETKEPLTLKTLCFCCWSSMPDYTLNFDEKHAKKLIFGRNRDLADLVPEHATMQEFQDALMSVRGNDKIQKKDWIQLNLILNAAVQRELLNFNVLVISSLVRSMEGKNSIHILSASLKKPKFQDDEERRMVEYMRKMVKDPRNGKMVPRFVRDSLVLIGAIQLFTGMPIREICALTWLDFSKIDTFNATNLAVTKHMDAHNHIIPNREYGHGRNYRLVALPYTLAEMLLMRKKYLETELHLDKEALKKQPIILSQEPGAKGAKRKDLHVHRQQALKASKQVLAAAKIDSKILTLLDGDARFDVDLNAYQNDLFASNFRWKAYYCAGFTEGDLAYHVGNVPPDTFSGHYQDYKNKFVQLMLSCKLDRWANHYRLTTAKADNNVFLSESVCSDWEKKFSTGAVPGATVQTELMILPEENVDAVAEISVYAKHGVRIMGKTYKRE